MVEIKFLKELPVRSLNKSELIKLAGADIYVDKDANRFAFFGFKNYSRSPMFSLYLVIKQYDSFGSFIRETKFSLPNIYVKSGTYVMEKPVRIADECEGCEVYIAYAEFATKQFYQDRLVAKSHLEDFTKDYFAGAPTSVSCSIGSNMVINQAAPASAAAQANAKVEEAKPSVEPITSTSTLPSEDEGVKPEESSAVFGEHSVMPDDDKESRVTFYKKRLSFANIILLGACGVAFAVLATVLFVIF